MVTESFSVSPTHSWLCGVVVKVPDWESVGCEYVFVFAKKVQSNFKYKIGKNMIN